MSASSGVFCLTLNARLARSREILNFSFAGVFFSLSDSFHDMAVYSRSKSGANISFPGESKTQKPKSNTVAVVSRIYFRFTFYTPCPGKNGPPEQNAVKCTVYNTIP